MKTLPHHHPPLKIAIVSDAIYPYNKGGKEKRIFELSTRLAQKGHQVTIYCMKWWKGKETSRIENGVHLEAISKLYPLYSGKRRSIKQALFFALSCFKLVTKNFDIIDVDHMPHLILFPLKIVTLVKRKKLIVTWNEVWGRAYWVEYLGLLGNLAYVIEWLSARLPDKIVAVSEHTKKKLVHDLKIKNKIVVVPNGIDFDKIQQIKPSGKKSDIIFAGRLLANKNVDILLKATELLSKEYPTLKILIVGEGPEKENLQKVVKNLSLEKYVEFLGFLKTHEELYSLMKSAKMFVFPSNREGFGIAALEANACGLPVLTTTHKDNATKDLIQEGINGYLFDGSVPMLATTIRKTMKNNLDKKKIIQTAQKYNWESISEQLEGVYEK